MTETNVVHFAAAKAGRKQLRNGAAPASPEPPPARIPRVSRLMALAIHFDGLIRAGTVRDYADLARLGGITRARATQIMGLLNLAPEIQEELLFLRGAEKGRDAVTMRKMLTLTGTPLWKEQREALSIKRD